MPVSLGIDYVTGQEIILYNGYVILSFHANKEVELSLKGANTGSSRRKINKVIKQYNIFPSIEFKVVSRKNKLYIVRSNSTYDFEWDGNAILFNSKGDRI